MDDETNLVYMKARFYDPDSGRFLTEDTYLGQQDLPPSLNRYLYTYSNPTKYIDPDGHKVYISTDENGKKVFSDKKQSPQITDEQKANSDKVRQGHKDTPTNYDGIFEKYREEEKKRIQQRKNQVPLNTESENSIKSCNGDIVCSEQQQQFAKRQQSVEKMWKKADDVLQGQTGFDDILEQLEDGAIISASGIIIEKGSKKIPLKRFYDNAKEKLTGKKKSKEKTDFDKSKDDYKQELNKKISDKRKGQDHSYDRTPRDLKEQLSMKEARSIGKSRTGEVKLEKLKDQPRLENVYGEGRWVKKGTERKNADGSITEIHWHENLDTGQNVEYKFKRYDTKTGNAVNKYKEGHSRANTKVNKEPRSDGIPPENWKFKTKN